MYPVKVAPGLYLIPLDQELPGFTDFIGTWLYNGEKTFLVDAGPAATIPKLIKTLEILDVRHLDAILLTHIHIDHAGGIGDLVSRFPETPVVCHSSAIQHLADPARLWEGSLKALGLIARTYGPIRAVPPALLLDAGRFAEYKINPIQTPGHSPHHVSYRFGPFLFAGEAGGVFLKLSDGEFYMRPATPPRFFLETTIKSIDALLATPHDFLCYGHFGMTERTPDLLAAHRSQIFKWAEIIQQQMGNDKGEDFIDSCMRRLLEEDPLLAGWNRLKDDVKERESFFLHNSIRGFVQYLEESKDG